MKTNNHTVGRGLFKSFIASKPFNKTYRQILKITHEQRCDLINWVRAYTVIPIMCFAYWYNGGIR